MWDGDKKLSCPICQFVLYHNCAAAVAVLMKCSGSYFFTRRNMDPGNGKLDLPGGFVDPRESAEDTCKRELFEELSLEIQPEKLVYLSSLPNVYVYKEIAYNTLDLFYLYEINARFSATLEEKEISETVWLRAEDIVLSDIAFESQKKFLRAYLKLA